MTDGALQRVPKRASALRRIPSFDAIRVVESVGLEGAVCLFEIPPDEAPIVLESDAGRAMSVVAGDFLLGTPGYRESTRWVVGGIPTGGLVPRGDYWVLAECGVVGELVGASPLKKGHLGRVRYCGALVDDGGQSLSLGRFAAKVDGSTADQGAPIYLIVGTSAEVGKTTAGISILRALLQKGHAIVTALKATGTSSLTEILRYRDFGAARAFDCVDFGLPTTYPSDREGMDVVFEHALDTVLAASSDALVVECGGDILGGNVPVFLAHLRRRRANIKVILAAADALGALGGKQVLGNMGLQVSLITGPCTDTPTLQQRTQELCGVPAINLAQGASQNILPT
jgi:hypothetical protein